MIVRNQTQFLTRLGFNDDLKSKMYGFNQFKKKHRKKQTTDIDLDNNGVKTLLS